MLKKILFIAVAVLFVNVTVQSTKYFFVWDVKLLNEKQQWAKILEVERLILRGRAGIYINWIATVQVDDHKESAVYVSYGPVPKQGDCMPVYAKYLNNGKVFSLLDVEEWRFGAAFGPCD